jgi:N-methylhydantoinase B
VRVETGGGGGYGPPFDRPVEAVLEDVLGGLVSVAAAREEYGVIISKDAIDEQATAVLRDRRPPVRAFHRHGYVDALT